MAIINYRKIINPPEPYVFTQDIVSFEKPAIDTGNYNDFYLYTNTKVLNPRDVIIYRDQPNQYFLNKNKKIILCMEHNNLISFLIDVFFPIFYLHVFEPTAEFIITLPSLKIIEPEQIKLFRTVYNYLINIIRKSNIPVEIITPSTEKIVIKNFFIYERGLNDSLVRHNLDLPKQLINKISNNSNPEKIIIVGRGFQNDYANSIDYELMDKFSVTKEQLSQYDVEYINENDFVNFMDFLSLLKNTKVAIVLNYSHMIPFLLFMPIGSSIVVSNVSKESNDSWRYYDFNPIFSQFMKTLIINNNLIEVLESI